MIRIFRENRRVLSGGNKVLWYLLYALGEIVLIVLGILFALQIDNWNEEQKARTTQKELINLFLLDLKDKKQEIISDKSFFENYLNEYQTFRSRWAQGQPPDTSNLKAVIITMTQDHWLFNTNSTTFENASSSELWKSLPDSLTQKVNTLYYAQFGWMKNYTERMTEYVARCKMEFLRPNYLLDATLPASEIIKIVEANSEEFLSYVIFFQQHINRMEFQWETASVLVDEVIGDIEQHQSQDADP